jgi:hypothetical protein
MGIQDEKRERERREKREVHPVTKKPTLALQETR